MADIQIDNVAESHVSVYTVYAAVLGGIHPEA